MKGFEGMEFLFLNLKQPVTGNFLQGEAFIDFNLQKDDTHKMFKTSIPFKPSNSHITQTLNKKNKIQNKFFSTKNTK